MKPKASLKSRNVNVRVMASRPPTSVQPLSLVKADLRSSGLSFCTMPHLLPRNARPSHWVRRDITFVGIAPAIRGSHVLVVEYRQSGGHGRPHPPDLPPVSRLDFRGGIRFGRQRGGLGRAPVHGAAVPVCAAAR